MGIGILPLIILGLIVGAIAKLIMPGKDPGGIIITMLLGIVGALVGGWLIGPLVGASVDEFFSISSWLLAIVGSLIVLGLYRLVAGRRAVRS